jgi:hypothetical protein
MMTDDMEDIVISMKVVGENMTNRSTLDEFGAYGKHVANELLYLKDINYRLLLLADTKHKINAALYETETFRVKLDI